MERKTSKKVLPSNTQYSITKRYNYTAPYAQGKLGGNDINRRKDNMKKWGEESLSPNPLNAYEKL